MLGHHIDTRYAFNDRLLFPDEATLERINMNHTPADNEAAAKRAMELFNGSIYHDKVANVSLFYQQLAARSKQLTALLTPRLGDSLVKADGTPWMAGFLNQGPKLNPEDTTQIAALPLGSHLKIDPWDSRVYALNLKAEPILNPGDKMPMELTPIFFRLQRYQAASAAPTPANTPAPPQQTQPQAPAADGNGGQPAVQPQQNPQ
jgi:hypothetical protein